jgi:uncharacterized protein (TIGR02246 family)
MKTSTDLRREIDQAEQRFIECFNAGDAKGLAALYTPGAQLFPDDSDAVSGREAIAEMFEELLKHRPHMRVVTKEVQGFGRLAYEVGAFTLVTPEAVEHGHYIIVWMRSGNGWQLHRDIFNVSARTPRPKQVNNAS